MVGDTWSPRAVVFDCDGLLMDTEACWTTAETAMFAERGLSFTPAHKAALIGRSLAHNAATISKLLGDPAAGALEQELLERVLDVVAREARAMPGAAEIVARLAATMPIAVASNAPRALLDAALARSGFAKAFTATLAAEEVAAPKPHPAIYLAACQRLHCDPVGALAFEDSETGARAARSAGLRVVCVPTLDIEIPAADAHVDSLLDQRLARWIEEWPPSPQASSAADIMGGAGFEPATPSL